MYGYVTRSREAHRSLEVIVLLHGLLHVPRAAQARRESDEVALLELRVSLRRLDDHVTLCTREVAIGKRRKRIGTRQEAIELTLQCKVTE